MNRTRKKWGLVLSGGAAWGMANAGVLQVLDREKITPDYIAGSSMGAIIAGIYALHKDVRMFDELIANLSLLTIAKISASPLKSGLHGGMLTQNLESILRDTVGNATIDDCEIPFVCTAGRIKKPIQWSHSLKKNFMEEVYESVELETLSGNTKLIDALMATSAIPVLFSPHKIGDNEYVDLLNFGAIPSRTLRSIHNPDIVIGTDTAPRHTNIRHIVPSGMKHFLETSNESLEESRKACDLIIRPEYQHGYFRFDKAQEFVDAGKAATEKNLTKIEALLNN